MDADSNAAKYANRDHVHRHQEQVEGNIQFSEILQFDSENPKPLPDHNPKLNPSSDVCFSVSFVQKLLAEGIGTYFLMFAGCAALEVNLSNNGVVTLPGIALVWGLAVVIMVYSIGHISGCHLNPAVTIAFASCRRFPFKQVPAYIFAQVLGSILAIATLRLLFEEGQQNDDHHHFLGSTPSGSNLQSLVLEFIVTFLLMFVVSGVATDNRATGELAGLAIGSTIIVNILYAGPISGCSMNPARSLGPAIVYNRYENLWIYFVGPIGGAIAGVWAYNLIRLTDKPPGGEIRERGPFLGNSGRSNGSR